MDINYVPIILLFHSKKDVAYSLKDLFGSSTWIDVDLAGNDHDLVLNVITRQQSQDPARPVRNLCIWNGHHRCSSRKWLTQLCSNNIQYRLKIVIICDEFIEQSISKYCMTQVDYIIVQRRRTWPPNLFTHMNVPKPKVEASTCDLVGISGHSAEFIEFRFEDEEASRVRCIDRCAKIFEQLMVATWHPSRMRAWCLDHSDEFCDGEL